MTKSPGDEPGLFGLVVNLRHHLVVMTKGPGDYSGPFGLSEASGTRTHNLHLVMMLLSPIEL